MTHSSQKHYTFVHELCKSYVELGMYTGHNVRLINLLTKVKEKERMERQTSVLSIEPEPRHWQSSALSTKSLLNRQTFVSPSSLMHCQGLLADLPTSH